MNMLLPTEDSAIYGRADLVANWYKRYLRIFVNINRVADSEEGGILVIIGAGHLKLLKGFAQDAPYYELADTERYFGAVNNVFDLDEIRTQENMNQLA